MWYWWILRASTLRPCAGSIGYSVRQCVPTAAACYKASILLSPMREVLMRRLNDLGSTDQLTMFHPLPTTPRWESIPVEARERPIKLLARLLQSRRRSVAFQKNVRSSSSRRIVQIRSSTNGWETGA